MTRPKPTPDGYTDLVVYVVNADNPSGDRPSAEFPRELRAMAEDADLIFGQETVRYGDLDAPGMVRRGHRNRGQSRQNVTIWVRDTLPVGRAQYDDLKTRWPRIQGKGWHPSRSNLRVKVGRTKGLAGHAPQAPRPSHPAATREALNNARREWVTRTARRLDGPGAGRKPDGPPFLAGLDPNGLAEQVANHASARWVGGAGAALVYAGCVVIDQAHVRDLPGGVEFKGDHGNVLRLVVRVESRWLEPRRLLAWLPWVR